MADEKQNGHQPQGQWPPEPALPGWPCPNCGYPRIPPGTRLCPNCGRRVKRKPFWTIFSTFGCLGFLALWLGAFYPCFFGNAANGLNKLGFWDLSAQNPGLPIVYIGLLVIVGTVVAEIWHNFKK